MKKKIFLICAVRPNFMKVAPLYHILVKEDWLDIKLIHTGQHYDPLLSDVFFKQLKLPQPDYFLGIGSGSHAQQTGKTMIEFEKLCVQNTPDMVVVFGDVNATLACSIAAKKLGIAVAHVEAGLRSFDMSMPEEINRVLVDRISDLLLTPSEDANQNLKKEGIDQEKIKFVGNIMIDSYEMQKEQIEASIILDELNLTEKRYGVLTLHRPVNVDDWTILEKILRSLSKMNYPIIFPVHPRTQKSISTFSSGKEYKNINFVSPKPYIEFMKIVSNSAFVVTDSGGLQEETSYLSIPCFTIRENTERPITITDGTNELVKIDQLCTLEQKLHQKKGRIRQNIPLWDGMTSHRILECIKGRFSYEK